MRLLAQNCASKSCRPAHPQPSVSVNAAHFLPTSNGGRDAFIQQSSWNVQPSSHQTPPHCPLSYTQFTIVTCVCSFNQCIVCEEKASLGLASALSCELEDPSHSQQLHCRAPYPVPYLAPSPTGETVVPSWSSGLHICVDTGACKRSCCTRAHLGKRVFLAARRTLARFGLGRRRSVSFQSSSPTDTEHYGQASTEQFLSDDSTSRMELQGYLPPEADSGMSWELPTTEIDHAPRELPAELSSEGYMPHGPVSISESSVSNNPLSPHLVHSRNPARCRAMLQASISTLDTSFSDIDCPSSVRGSQNPSDVTNDEDDTDHLRSLSDEVEQGPALKTVVGDPKLPIQEVDSLAGRVQFCESPTSISSEMGPNQVELKMNPWRAPIGAFPQSSVLANRQTLSMSNGYTRESPEESYLHRQPCHGILKHQRPDHQLSSPSNQHRVAYESSNCNRSASTGNCLYLERLALLRGPSSAQLLEILNAQSGKLDGIIPTSLFKQVGVLFASTSEQSLRKLNELQEPEFRAIVEPVNRIKATLDAGLSALNSLVIGQVPNRLDGVMSLLFIAYSTVILLVDEQNQAQFTDGLFLDAIEWTDAIECHEEQDAFEMLLHYVWLPAAISSVCTHGHPWSRGVWRSFRLRRTPPEPTSIPFMEGRLDHETKTGFRLRTGLNAQICQWYVDREYRQWAFVNQALTGIQISIRPAPFVAVLNPIHLRVTG